MIRGLWRRRRDSEHGGVATIVAVLAAGGVLLGMGALVIDVGRLYVEREQLQSGADAASMRVAVNCARNIQVCTYPSQNPTANAYAGKNAKDGLSDAQICIRASASPAPVWGGACPTSTAGWKTQVTCPPTPSPSAGTYPGNSVEVRTTTLTTTGALLPPSFAQALAGGGYTGKTVGACARVSWGPPVAGPVLALGISLCDWKRMTNNGQVTYNVLTGLLSGLGLYPLMGLPNPTSGVDTAIPQGASVSLLGLGPPLCTTPLDGSPRGYVWLNNPNGTVPDTNCMINVKVGDLPRSYLLSNGLISGYCTDRLKLLLGKPVLVPIYDYVEPAILSLGPAFRIVGFAPFVPTGYNFIISGLTDTVKSVLSLNVPAALGTTSCLLTNCVFGYFTQTLSVQPRPQFGNGSNFGANVVGRTG